MSCVAGLFWRTILGQQVWLAASLAVSTSIMGMQLSATLHRKAHIPTLIYHRPLNSTCGHWQTALHSSVASQVIFRLQQHPRLQPPKSTPHLGPSTRALTYN